MGFFKSVLIDAVCLLPWPDSLLRPVLFYVSSVGVALLASLVLAV